MKQKDNLYEIMSDNAFDEEERK